MADGILTVFRMRWEEAAALGAGFGFTLAMALACGVALLMSREVRR